MAFVSGNRNKDGWWVLMFLGASLHFTSDVSSDTP